MAHPPGGRDSLNKKMKKKIQGTKGERSPPNSPPPTTTEGVQRRLGRLAEYVDRTELRNHRVVFDFDLSSTPQKVLEGVRQLGMGDITGFQRWGGSKRSVAFLESDRNDRYWVTEFTVRLAYPSHFEGADAEIPEAVAALVSRIEPPTQGTVVWIRPTSWLNGTKSRYGYRSRPTPHIGAMNVSVHPGALLDFVAEFLRAYRDEFVDE